MGKVYARAEKIPDETSTYLTAGKMYPVTFEDGRLFNITHDHDHEIACLWTDCPHLGGDWTRVVVEEFTESTPVITLGTVAPDEAGTYLTAGKLCWAPDPEDPTQRPVCASCGGEDVTIDATASWDTEAKEWTLLSTDETNSWCEDCGGECSIDWIEVTE